MASEAFDLPFPVLIHATRKIARDPGVQNPVALVGYEINPTASHLNI
jgi:hypothetical protein